VTSPTPASLAAEAPQLERPTDEHSGERFLEVVGPRIALLGDELGRFEAWIWPLKVLRLLEPHFVHGDGPTWTAEAASRSVAVTPHEVVLSYAGPDWSVAMTWLAAPDARAAVALLDVRCERTLRVVLHLEPQLRPMWPAGLGGESAGADCETGALVVTEELGRFAVLVGSPEADPLRTRGDHALPRDPMQVEIPISPERARLGPVPVALAGAELEPPPVSEAARRGEQGAARGEARSRAVVERARDAWREALSEWPRWRLELRGRWQGYLGRTTRLTSTDARLDAAFEWARVALERSWVEVEGLGRGLVAGLGRSGNGERPGFGWFFDGDALVAARALTGCGDFQGAREVLRFAARHQRQDGKLMHELVLSARLCRWIEDYPYAYYKAGNTPAFLAVLAHYVAGSGDLELARELWPNALGAFEHGLRSLDADGLFSVRKAGLAAVEAGEWVGALRSEVYVQGIWVSAARGLRDLARLLGEPEVETRARAAVEQAQAAFERFWSDPCGRYGFARLADDTLAEDLSAYLALPLGRGVGQPERAQASAQALNHPKLSTEWGARLFAQDSSVYDPDDYNSGSVFPYLGNHVVLAQYRHGLAPCAWQGLAALVALHGHSGLGFVPEHLVGDRCEEPLRGVPHQLFSSAAVLQSTLYGLWGLAGHALEGTLLVRPALPPHVDRIELRGWRQGESVLDLSLARDRVGGRTTLALEAELRRGPPLRLFFRPWLPALSRDVTQGFDDDPRRLGVAVEPCGACLVPQGPAVELIGRTRVILDGELGPEPWLDTDLRLERGQPPRAVRLAGVRCAGGVAHWTFWGTAGGSATVPLSADRALAVRGAERTSAGHLVLEFPSAPDASFTSVEVVLEGLE